MRNLTLKREKTFVACLGKMKVYIESPDDGELKINGKLCRKLGELKNGEEKTFEIDDREAEIYVIADTLSKEYCNDFYKIPEGNEDVYLSGKNTLNPATGNAFRFNAESTPATIKNRKKGLIIGLIVLVVAFIVGYVVGYSIIAGTLGKTKAKTFSEDGVTIELTNKFSKLDIENYTLCYSSKDTAVFFLEEKFSLLEGFENYTLPEYADLVLEGNKLTGKTTVQNKDGLTYFINHSTVDGKDYCYYIFLFKETDSFWLVQFATEDKLADSYSDSFFKWAGTVKFD